MEEKDFLPLTKVPLVVLPLTSKKNLLVKTPKYKHKVGGVVTEPSLGGAPAHKGMQGPANLLPLGLWRVGSTTSLNVGPTIK